MRPELRVAIFTITRLGSRPMEAFAILFLSVTSVASSLMLPSSLGEQVVVTVLLTTGIPLIGYLAMSEASRFFADYHIFHMEVERGVSRQVGEIQFLTVSVFFTLIFAIQAALAVVSGRVHLLPAITYFLILVFSLGFALRLVLIATRSRVRENVDLSFTLVVVPLLVLAAYGIYIGIGTIAVMALSNSMLSSLLVGLVYAIVSFVATLMVGAAISQQLPRVSPQGANKVSGAE